MPTVEELILEIRGEGVGETKDDLEGVEESMDDTAESAGDSAEELEGFSNRFQGAMTAAVTALAVGAAGLLSQVPVLGEAFGGLGAIVDAVALKMDETLRPAISDVTDELFKISGKINDSEGESSNLIGQFGTLAASAGLVTGALAALGFTIAGPLGLAIAGITAAIALLLTAWETNFAGIQDITKEAINSIKQRFNSFIETVGPPVRRFLNKISNLFQNNSGKIKGAIAFAFRTSLAIIETVIDGILTALEVVIQLLDGDFKGAWQSIKDFIGRMVGLWGPLVSEAADTVKEILGKLAQAFADWAGGLADDAVDFGMSVIEGFVQGIKDALNNAGAFLDDVAATVGIDLPDVDALGTGDATLGSGVAAGSSADRAFSGFSSGGGTSGGQQIDGRQLTESTGRYRTDPSRRRGL